MSDLVPEGWKYTNLGKHIRLQGGFAFKSQDFADNGVPVIRISNIKENGINFSGSVFVKEKQECSSFEINLGDILIAMSGATTGKIGRYNNDRRAYLNQRVGRFLPKSNSVDLNYIAQIVVGDGFKDAVLIDAIGGSSYIKVRNAT